MRTPEDRRLRSLRPPKPLVDPWRPLGVELEAELSPEGVLEHSMTVFLSGQECVFTCAFCDLWRYTTDTSTPLGAIPKQIGQALEEQLEIPDVIKLYNASNFFDRSIPSADDEVIAELMGDISRVVVECHPRLLGRRCVDFSARLEGRLEVAMGFETAHPEALKRLNKKANVDDLKAAAQFLGDADVDLRAFVLIGAPYIDPGEQLQWLLRTTELALEQGARLVSLIPLRGGEGELGRLEQSGAWMPPTLEQVEESYERARALSPHRVRLDTWDLERLTSVRGGDVGPRLEKLKQRQLDTSGVAA